MKLLNRGWQYSVYEKAPGIVLKRYNSFLVAYFIMLKESFVTFSLPVIPFYPHYQKSKENASRSLEFISQSQIDKSVFGQPHRLNEYDYEQAYVEPLSNYFKRVSTKDGKDTIDAFVRFCALLLEHSIAERNFSIANNFGLDNNGNIVLTDLGEICTTEAEIQERINVRVWSTADVLSGLPASLRTYFVEKMDRQFLAD